MIKKLTFLCICICVLSCNEKAPSIPIEENNNLKQFFEKEMKNNSLSKNKFIFYLVLRDCSCVEENIEFVKENLNSSLKHKLTLIVKPDISNKYLKEFKKIQSDLSKKITLYIDYDETFSNYGNVYVTDKLFITEGSDVVEKIELKAENFKQILAALDASH